MEEESRVDRVLEKGSKGLRSDSTLESGKANSSTGPALSFTQERKLAWTRSGPPRFSVVPSQKSGGAHLLPQPTDGLFVVKKSARNALFIEESLETGTVDNLDRLLLRAKLLRNLIGNLHVQPRGGTRGKREVCDEDGAIARFAIHFFRF